MLRYLLLLITLLIPLGFVFYTYRFLDHKKMEPKRAVVFALLFSFLIFFIEFFLVKPAIGKLSSFFDTYFFVYFISEEPEQLKSLSLIQNCLIIFLAAFSKAITYSIGLKVLFTWLYRLGRKKIFAGRHVSKNGFLDEPIDYTVYSLFFFTGLALVDNLIHFRLNSALSVDKIQAFLLLFVYLSMAIAVSLIWLNFKINNRSSKQITNLFGQISKLQLSSSKTFLFGLLSKVEFYCFLILLITLILLKLAMLFSKINTLLILLLTTIILSGILFIQISKIGNYMYSIDGETNNKIH